MALLLTSKDVRSMVTEDVALDAMREVFRIEAAGRACLPARLDAPTPTGFLRTMPAVLDGSMGLKVMTLAQDLGTRYLVLLYDTATSELQALIDADELTRMRTAATTTLGAMHMLPEPPRTLSVIGTGFEAQGHVEFLASQWPLEEICVYSRSEDNRRQFAEKLSKQLELRIIPVQTKDEAASAGDTILLATKSPRAVIDGAYLRPGAVVLSIGSTRPDLRELDRATFARADTVVVDALTQVTCDSGDVRDALEAGVLTTDRLVPLSELTAQNRVLDRSSGTRDVTVFKSAGTALQDLGLARRVHTLALESGVGTDLGQVTTLKPFVK